MDFQDRIKLILNYVRYTNDKQTQYPYGIAVSVIRASAEKNQKVSILDSDIKYLFDKKYLEPFFTTPGYKFGYFPAFNYLVRITVEGIDYLEEQKSMKVSPQSIQVIQSEVANVSQFGNVYNTIVNINDAFKQVYNIIEQNTKDNLPLKEGLTKDVKEIEEELKKDNFEKIKGIIVKIKQKAKFLLPVLQQLIYEFIKIRLGL